MYRLGLTLMVGAAILTGCDNPTANKPAATTTAPTTASTPSSSAATPARQAKGEGLAITPENSKIEFVGSKVTGHHDGGFKQFSGLIDLVNGKPEESQVSVDMQTASVYADADALTKHLQTADFFDVAKFPTATFTSTKIVADASKGANAYTVTGDLDLHGVKKAVTFPAMITVTPTEVTVMAEFSINRKDFGIVYAGQADNLINDDVLLKLNLKTPRNK